jgi:serine/threonine protein kinase
MAGIEMCIIRSVNKGKFFAIKIIKNDENMKGEKLMLNFKKNSKYLVKIIDNFIENNNCFIIMENCDGGDLMKFLKENEKLSKNVLCSTLFYFLFV